MKFKVRFSLLNLILLTIIVALSATVYRLGSEIVPLRRESKRLNEERGTLVIEDRSLVSAIRVPEEFAGRSGSFRVFVPEGKTYVAIVAVNDIPKRGFPEVERRDDADMLLGQAGANAFARLPSGEHQVSLTVHNSNHGKPQIRFALEQPGVPLDTTVHVRNGNWPEIVPETYSVFSNGVTGKTESVPSDQPLVLMRYRIEGIASDSISVSYRVPEPDHPLEGMMLWIEPLGE